MAKRVRKSKAEGQTVFRCDKLPTFMNVDKEIKLRNMLSNWRYGAGEMSYWQWKIFDKTQRFDPFYDPATEYRKETVAVRAGLLRQLNTHFSVAKDAITTDVTDKKRKALPKLAPGLMDPTASVKDLVGAAQFQMIRAQVLGTLESYISNRQNDFVSAVFAVNRARAWFTLKREITITREQHMPRNFVFDR